MMKSDWMTFPHLRIFLVLSLTKYLINQMKVYHPMTGTHFDGQVLINYIIYSIQSLMTGTHFDGHINFLNSHIQEAELNRIGGTTNIP